MRRERRKRTRIIIALCGVLFMMSVGYAAFQTKLDIKGTGSVTNSWDIEITNVTEGNSKGTGESAGSPTWNSLTAYMEANLYEKGDAMEYEITIQNKGNLDAKLDSITKDIKTNNDAIKISFSGYTKGERLYSKGHAGDTKTIIAKIEYNQNFTGEVDLNQSSEVSITLNYVQAEGKEGTDVSEPNIYLANYDCTTNGGESCTEYNEYLKEGETVNLLYKGNNSKYEFIGWNTDPKAREGLISLQMGLENITLYAIYETDPIIQSWSSTDTSDFHSEAYKQSIISAEFLNTREIPENATESWDVSAAKDKSVMAWVIPDTTDNTKHHLYIGGKGGVIANENSSALFFNFANIKTIEFHNNFDTKNVINMNYMFQNCSSLAALDLRDLDTSNVNNMSSMFDGCRNLTNLDLSGLNTSKVIYMERMFKHCINLIELDLSSFDTSNVVSMRYMFGTNTYKEPMKLQKIIFGNNFDTSKVTDMASMFYCCDSLIKLDLCSWNTSKVTNMTAIFAGTSKLEKVYVGPNWTTANADITNMFGGSKISSVTQSNNCFVEAEDPATINITTTKTTNSITVITEAKAESGISKYEYSKDNGSTWEESTEPIHTFTGLTQETTYNIKVRVTSKVGKQTTSNTISATTNVLEVPTFEEVEKDTNKEITITYPEGCGDTITCSYQKDKGEWKEVKATTEIVIFDDAGNIIAKATDGTNETSSSYVVIIKETVLNYNGEAQTFTANKDGYYKIELWGAQGGNATYGGKGAYTSGEVYLNKDENLYLNIGQQPMNVTSVVYNGGGISNSDGRYTSGGGATDVRLVGGSWDNPTSLNSRIMVAAGGGGAYVAPQYNSYTNGSSGGTLIGLNGLVGECAGGTACSTVASGGGNQTVGGKAGTGLHTNGNSGTFGYGGNGNGKYTAGGGGGYYGGGSSGVSANQAGTGAGGSSYISGYAGVNSITSEINRVHTNQTTHYSGKYFINTQMKVGVNSGNGKAKITYLGKTTIKEDSKKIIGVRYIKDCINGNTVNTYNHWLEIQAINNGVNVAKGKNVTGTATENTSYPRTRIVDGIIDNVYAYADATTTGYQCITIDLGREYDLEEVAIWHFYGDGRTYNNNITYVAGEDNNFNRSASLGNIAETANGKHIKEFK